MTATEAYEEWKNQEGLHNLQVTRSAWLAACAWKEEQVILLLSSMLSTDPHLVERITEAIHQLK